MHTLAQPCDRADHVTRECACGVCHEWMDELLGHNKNTSMKGVNLFKNYTRDFSYKIYNKNTHKLLVHGGEEGAMTENKT